MAIRSATKNPMIVVVMTGGPVDISWAKVGNASDMYKQTTTCICITGQC